MQVVELLQAKDPELYLHLNSCAQACNTTVVLLVVWPLLRTLLSESLPHDEWLSLWDHLIASWRQPALLGACVVALLRGRRASLLVIGRLSCRTKPKQRRPQR